MDKLNAKERTKDKKNMKFINGLDMYLLLSTDPMIKATLYQSIEKREYLLFIPRFLLLESNNFLLPL